MNETDSEMQRDLRAERLDPILTDVKTGASKTGASAEMRRQMEAAKQRMKKYHAVYAPSGKISDHAPAGPVVPSEEQ